MTIELRITQGVLDAVTQMAEVQGSRGPSSREVCGLLVAGPKAPGDVIDGFWTLSNVHDRPGYRYAVDPAEQLEAWQSIEGAGLQVAGWYHSHIEHGPELSAEDIAMAADPALVHLVFSVPGREFRAWRVGVAGDAASVVRALIEVV